MSKANKKNEVDRKTNTCDSSFWYFLFKRLNILSVYNVHTSSKDTYTHAAEMTN